MTAATIIALYLLYAFGQAILCARTAHKAGWVTDAPVLTVCVLTLLAPAATAVTACSLLAMFIRWAVTGSKS